MLEMTGPRRPLASASTPPSPRARVSPPPDVPRNLPSFLSPAPPRSEGEALLRRIFS